MRNFADLFTRRYVLALTIIALFTAMGQAYVHYRLGQQTEDGYYINQAGRQRMYSQKIAKTLFWIHLQKSRGTKDDNQSKARTELESLWNNFQQTHKDLVQVAVTDEFGSPKLRSHFSRLTPHYEGLKEAVSLALKAETMAEWDSVRMLVEANESGFLSNMDEIAVEFEYLAAQRILDIRTVVIIFALVLFLALLFEGYMIFRPTVRQLAAAFSDMEVQREEITKQAKELSQQKNMLELVTKNMSEGLIVANDNFEFLLWNEKGKEIIGFGATDSEGDEWSDVYGLFYEDKVTPFPPEDLPLAKAIRGIETNDVRMYVNNPKLESGIYIEVSGRPLRDNEKILGGVIVLRDVTESLQRAEELKLAKSRAEEGERAKSRFLATMSHEIRTPMNAVLSCAALLLDNIERPENRKLLDTILTSGDTLLSLINDILDFSKIESDNLIIEIDYFNLESACFEIVNLLNFKAGERGVQVSLDFAEDVPQAIQSDRMRFKQVLMNLVGNAVKFSNSEVKVEVTSQVKKDDVHEICVSVKDDGVGIREEDLDKLFRDFSQLQASQSQNSGGSGLGLAICKGIIDAMGGEIWVESTYGAGAKFSFKFEAEAVEGDVIESMGQNFEWDQTLAERLPMTILLAEDNEVNCFVATQLLSRLGYKPDIVNNGKEALEAVKVKQYDLILMDQHMPEMDGLEATQNIRALDIKQPKIVAVTANVFQEDKEKCLNVGMDDFLAKPIHVDELARVLKGEGSPLRRRQQELNVMSRFKDNIETGHRVAQKFLETLPNMIESLDKAITSQNSAELERHAHSLKGAAGNFNATVACDLAFQLECCGRDSNFADTESSYTKLLDELIKLKSKLEDELKSKKKIS